MKSPLFQLSAITLLLAPSASSQLFTFEFTGSPTGDGQYNQVTSQPTNASVSPITRHGVTFRPRENAFDSANWGQGFSRDETKYLSFTVSADPGFAVTISGLKLNFVRGTGGPLDLQALAYVNGLTTGRQIYQTSFLMGIIPLASGSIDVSFGSPLTNVTTAEIRFFGYDVSSDGGTLSFDNLGLKGSIIPLPSLDLQSPRIEGNHFKFQFTAQTGMVYRLESRESLTSGDWTPVGSEVQAVESLIQVSNPIGVSTQRFYRAVLLP